MEQQEMIVVAAEKGGGSLVRRGVLVVLATIVAAIALALVVAIGVSPKKADAATAVTKTFSNPAQILIPNGAVVGNCPSGPTKGRAAPYPSHQSVGAFSRGSRILDVNLTLRNFTHTFPDDVDILLVHTKGTSSRNRTVMSDVGGSIDVNNITLTLDDEARFNNFMPNDGPLVTDTYFPTNVNLTATDTFPAPAPAAPAYDPSPELSGFDGQKANGSWDLFVVDDSGADCGRFAGGWSITIKAR
jgi:hypothetical protein